MSRGEGSFRFRLTQFRAAGAVRSGAIVVRTLEERRIVEPNCNLHKTAHESKHPAKRF